MLAYPEKINADLIGQDCLLDQVPNNLAMRQKMIVGTGRDIAKRIQPQLKRIRHRSSGRSSPAPPDDSPMTALRSCPGGRGVYRMVKASLGQNC
jgi:hypothetical protein